MTAHPASLVLKLHPNVPTEIKLATSSALNVTGQYGPQMLFSLTGNRRLYVPVPVGEEIQALTLPPGGSFILTRSPRDVGRGFDWKVERKAVESLPAPPATSRASATQLEHALKTAIAAAKEAEAYGTLIGYTVRFSEESIRCMANTVLISMGRAA
jgi:hypothetical protein